MSGQAAITAPGVFERIRETCAEVTRRARFVRLDPVRLEALAEAVASGAGPEEDLDPGHDAVGDAATRRPVWRNQATASATVCSSGRCWRPSSVIARVGSKAMRRRESCTPTRGTAGGRPVTRSARKVLLRPATQASE